MDALVDCLRAHYSASTSKTHAASPQLLYAILDMDGKRTPNPTRTWPGNQPAEQWGNTGLCKRNGGHPLSKSFSSRIEINKTATLGQNMLQCGRLLMY